MNISYPKYIKKLLTNKFFHLNNLNGKRGFKWKLIYYSSDFKFKTQNILVRYNGQLKKLKGIEPCPSTSSLLEKHEKSKDSPFFY